MRGVLGGVAVLAFLLAGCGPNLGEKGTNRNADRPKITKGEKDKKDDKKDKKDGAKN